MNSIFLLLCVSLSVWVNNSVAVPERESDTRLSTSGFFHESESPRPPSIPLGPF
jgi:hypothetical protein